VKLVISSLFGKAGLAIDKFLRKLNWVYIFRSFPGLFPYLTYRDVYLEDPEEDITALNDPKEFPVYFGEYIIDLLVGEDDEENDTNTGDSAGTGNVPNTSTCIFDGVIDRRSARMAMRLFLFIRYVSRTGKINHIICLKQIYSIEYICILLIY